MYQFNYHRATSVADAVAKLKGAGDGKLMAGGMTLLPTLKMRLANPSDVIDLGGIAALREIAVANGQVSIGALVTHDTVAQSAPIAQAIPALAGLALHIGDPQVRNRGTIGGSVANNDPAADYPAALLGLGATVHTDRRTITADAFFKGMFETALAADEIVTKITFPVVERAAYMKFPNPASRYAIVGVFVSKGSAGVRVAVTGAGASVFRASDMEKALAASFQAKAIEGITVSAAGLNSDIHAGADYRAHLVGVMARRAVTACA
ncbi:MAG: xanthine dehydrogenase family protein subunit M [Alphaproteobacteria bacterium]|nr:xanthine dehydrogenase family protein subunit M [Alphaproteobacteria bacterium]